MPTPGRLALVLTAAAAGGAAAADGSLAVDPCPGSVHIDGYGNASVVATQWNSVWQREDNVSAGPVRVLGGAVVPDMWGRAYLADACPKDGVYSNSDYLALQLLGKRLRYTTDLSKAGCGCNAAMYLVSMRQNPIEGNCSDYYCDANSVCGVSCTEIDIQEANRHAWHTAPHVSDDRTGVSVGYGGNVTDGTYDFGKEEYGPYGRCIDTLRPFSVSAEFPVWPNGTLRSIDLVLSQRGPCDIRFGISSYDEDPDFELLTQALSEGMTPALSYWESKDMAWLDGPGDAGDGPCREDTTVCGPAPHFWDFAVEDL